MRDDVISINPPGYYPDAIAFRDMDHVPYNKRPSEVHDCYADLIVASSALGGWSQFQLQETVKHPSGRYQTRVISLSITRAQALRLAQHIIDTHNKITEES